MITSAVHIELRDYKKRAKSQIQLPHVEPVTLTIEEDLSQSDRPEPIKLGEDLHTIRLGINRYDSLTWLALPLDRSFFGMLLILLVTLWYV